ncbi:MAG: hypothetical protein ACK55Z_18350 [bacterium]
MAFDNPEADQDADAVYNQICEEQGIALESEGLGGSVGQGVLGVKKQEEAKIQDNEVDELQKRLDNLNQ